MEFTNWVNLGTMAGAVAAVLIVVQYIKAPLDRVWKIPTRLVVYLLACICLFGSDVAIGGITWESAGINLVNAFIVALAAMGAYEATYNKTKKSVEEYAGEDK